MTASGESGVDDPAEPVTKVPSRTAGPEPEASARSTPSRDGRRPATLPPTHLPSLLDRELADGELADRVIQRIFAAGLALNRAVDGSTPAVAAAIEQAIAELDRLVRDIRTAAYNALAPTRSAQRTTTSADLDDAV